MRAIFLQTGDLGRAEECAQEAFLRAWQRRRELAHADPVRWVTKAAFRLAVSDWRKHSGLRRALERREAQPATVEPAPERLVYVAGLLAQLPYDHRCVVVLHYFHDLGVTDVADVLGISPGTVKSRLSRARDRLRAAISTEEADDRLG